MKNPHFFLWLIISIFSIGSNIVNGQQKPTEKFKKEPLDLPDPDTKASVTNFSKVLEWPVGQTPKAPEGFVVTRFADQLKSPRNIITAPNGDIIVVLANKDLTRMKKFFNSFKGKSKAGKSENTILLMRDGNKDGKPELVTTFLSGLKQPFGVGFLDDWFYVANTNAVWRYPYKTGDTVINGKGEKILDLPDNGINLHWTRNLIVSPAKDKIYISVGSGSNVAKRGIKHEKRRANIIQINPDGSGEKIYGSGLRNPVGMAFAPGTNVLWTAVNERDGLGDDLVPDYITSVKEGGFYGWPYAYFGQNEDPRQKGKNPEMVKKSIVPDIEVGSHTASLGLIFYTHSKFPEKYHGGVFLGQHGSWNRSELAGYKVAYIPFKQGKQTGELEDFLTGFIADEDKSEVYGRPVCVAIASDGSLLVTDDVSGIIWRVAKNKKM